MKTQSVIALLLALPLMCARADSEARTYHLGGFGTGLILVVGPTVTTSGGGVTVSVTVTGTADSFGGSAIKSQAVDVEYDPAGNLVLGMDLSKAGDRADNGSECPPGEQLDKSKVRLDLDIPWAELDDGDGNDDYAGSAFGFSPTLGWGGGSVTG